MKYRCFAINSQDYNFITYNKKKETAILKRKKIDTTLRFNIFFN